MARLLVQSQGSVKDPTYDEQMLMLDGEEVPFSEFFDRQGIMTLIDDLVNSCHGHTQMTLGYASEIERLARDGHKVVAIQQGGLYFAKPSLEAANMPQVPVISIPLGKGIGGLAAFLAPILPSGTAVIGGVSNGNYQTAANVAARMLNREYSGVLLYNSTAKVGEKLSELNVPVLGGAHNLKLENQLILARVDARASADQEEWDNFRSLDENNLVVFTPYNTDEAVNAITLMTKSRSLQNSVYVKGDDNLAFYAAKILALSDPMIALKLRRKAHDKADSYDKRTITIDSFTGGK